MVVAGAFLQGCGNGATITEIPQVQKTAIVEFGTTTADPAAKLRGVSIVTTLPEGVTVATKPGTTEISSGALQGLGNNGQVLFGTYSAAIRKVKIAVPSVSSADMPIGPYAKLTCSVLPGYTLSATLFSAIVPIEFEATGPGGSDLTVATPPVISQISATFGY